MKKSKRREKEKMIALEKPGFVDAMAAGESKFKAIYAKNRSQINLARRPSTNSPDQEMAAFYAAALDANSRQQKSS